MVRTTIFKVGLRKVCTICNLPTSPEEYVSFAVNEMEEFYKTQVTLKDGATELFAYLKNAGVKLALASATSEPHIQIVLKRFNLENVFDAVLSCATLGVSKDKPIFF